MHNNIMAAGSRDRPPMLATGRYAQWRSRFLRYIDTRPNGDALRKCILKGPYTPTIVTTPVVPATEDSPAVPEQTTVETAMNMTPENRAHFESEKEAIHLILTGIGDEIYSTVDACQTAQSLWKHRRYSTKPTTTNLEVPKYQNQNEDTTPRNEESQDGLKTPCFTRKDVAVCKQAEKVFNSSSYMEKIQEVPNADSGTDAEPLEQEQYDILTIMLEIGDSNVTPDSLDMCDNDIQDDQNDVECDDERVALANLIANLKLDVDENKKIQKKLKKANATLTQGLTECKSILVETSRTLGESNSIRNSCLVALQNQQTEFERYKAFNDRTVNYDKLEQRLNETLGLLAQKETDIKESLKVKAYEISVVKEKHDELVKQSLLTKSHYEGLVKEKTKVITELKLKEEKDIDKMISMENQKNDQFCKAKVSSVFRRKRETYLEIQDLKLNSQDMANIAISELKKLIDKCKGKSVDTKFDKPSVVRQPNAQRIPKPSVLGKPAPFSNSLERTNFAKKKSVLKTNESEGLSKPVTPQNLPQKATQAIRNTNVIKPGMYRIASSTTQTRAPQLNQTSRNTNPRVSTSTGVTHNTNVSRPQPRSNQTKDKVVPNNSQVEFKKTEVEEHPRISSISNQTKSVTACNNSLKSRTLNVIVVCATCGKCVFNSNHDACVSKFLNDVNARTKKPNVVPISTRKPKSQANKSVATPHKKTVASESTITNSKSYYRMLYKMTSKAWKWWIIQQCPSAYTWVPKTKRKWVPKFRNESVTKKIVQLILFIVDSGCTKHMTGNLSLLCNFFEKYLGTVRFGNDQFAPILGYRDLVQGNITIKRVYYVEGLNHNLFSVGQFCDADLEVAFRKSTCFVRDLQGNDLLTGNRGTDLYTISLQETTSSTPICLMAKASPTQAWLWHRRLSHLNFDYINLLSKKDVVIGLPKLKYVKDQLCSSCEVSKAKRSSFKSKTVPSSKGSIKFAYWDLCASYAICKHKWEDIYSGIVDDTPDTLDSLFLR
ncbi:reverse transcriptase domain-containing protein [Tanacetum coccineum]